MLRTSEKEHLNSEYNGLIRGLKVLNRLLFGTPVMLLPRTFKFEHLVGQMALQTSTETINSLNSNQHESMAEFIIEVSRTSSTKAK